MDIYDLPDENDAIVWFLLNVVALPGSVVGVFAVALSVLGWISTARKAAGLASRAVVATTAVVRARRGAVLLAMIVAQTAMIATSYVLGQMFQVMFVRNSAGRYLADGPAYELSDTLRLALDYDHWTPVSLRVVQGAVAFVILVDVLCLVTDRLEQPLLLITIPALGLAGIAAFVGVLVLIMGLTHYDIYTVGMAGLYALWVILLLGWSLLVRWATGLPRLLVDGSRVPITR